MTLDTWLANRWVTLHTTSAREVTDLLDAASRDLALGKRSRATDAGLRPSLGKIPRLRLGMTPW